MNDTNKEQPSGEYSLDLGHLVGYLIKRIWIIALAGILCGLLVLLYSQFVITPTYRSGVMLYVNNDKQQVENGQGMAYSDITASIQLVETYIVILESDTTMNEVIARAGVDLTPARLRGMISAGSVNETEVFRVSVTSTDADEAALLANTIKDVLGEQVEEIMSGSAMRCVDEAVPNNTPVGPHTARNTVLGLFVGVFVACAVLAVFAVMDGTIHSEEYLLQNYDFPILAKIPNFTEESTSDKYEYYAAKKKGKGV